MYHLEGQRFGRLVVIKRSSTVVYSSRGWECVCDCGKVVVKATMMLTKNKVRSCGCLQSDVARQTQLDRRMANTKEQAFAARHVVATSGCWEWTGRKDKDGYGVLTWRGKNTRAHRLSVELATGKCVTDALVVCHKCDNPGCVNPAHLFVGSVKDNATDARNKGRAFVGRKNGRAKMTDQDVLIVRSSSEPSTALAKRFGVSRGTINRARKGETWAHLNSGTTKSER